MIRPPTRPTPTDTLLPFTTRFRSACVIPDSFQSIHAHGLGRIAAATPKASTGDVQAKVDATLDLARLARDKGADLVLFPELNISAYADRKSTRLNSSH